MANYTCVTRSNFFHVKDNEEFKKMMKKVQGNEESLMVWEEKNDIGETVFGFGVYGGIFGYCELEEDCDDYFIAYNNFIDKLKEHVSDDDAVVIFESGHEKMRYVVGSATIVTSSEMTCVDIGSIANGKVRDLLGNNAWDMHL